MRIKYRREGGVIGMVFEGCIDTDHDRDGSELEAMVKEIQESRRVDQSDTATAAALARPDAFSHHITIDDGEGEQTITVGDPVPAQLAPLLRRLRAVAKPVPLS